MLDPEDLVVVEVDGVQKLFSSSPVKSIHSSISGSSVMTSVVGGEVSENVIFICFVNNFLKSLDAIYFSANFRVSSLE